MNKYPFVRKGLAVRIILLFVGTCIVPAIAQNIEKSQSTSRGNWLYVGGSGPGNYTRIQDAIDNASDGDTVFVYDDSSPYMERLYIHNNSIHLIGENKTTTIINSSVQMTIWFYQHDNILIQGFTLLNNCSYTEESYGVYLSSAENFTLTDTIIIGCHWGVQLSRCSNCSITNTEIRDGTTGISLRDVDTITLSRNQLTDNDYGIELINAKTNTISNNTFTNNGIYLRGNAYPNTFFGNTVNNKTLLYLENEHDLIIDNTSVGQLILIGCKNITIKNIELSNASLGIEIIHSDNCLVTNSKLHSNSYAGITFLEQCQNNTISYNDISSNSYGIMIEFDYQSNSIIGNTIRFNKKGINLGGSKNTIRDNIIEDNDEGIVVSGLQNVITNNIIANSTTIGLYLEVAYLCLIKSNNFINNQKHAGFGQYLISGNRFRKNYWDSSVGFGPKVIWGLQYIVIVGYPGTIEIPIPWVQFDWFPAREPYDIGV